MGKPKQQTISRFFAPKPQTPPPPSPQSPPPRVSSTVTFSAAKRRLSTPSPSSSNPSKLRKIPPNPSLHQRFLEKLLEPADNGLEQPPLAAAKHTPLEQQVAELKRKFPDVLLMVEVGYKFRFFGGDAETAARELGIYAHVDRSFLTASVPVFRLGVHVRRLVAAGHKVGVVRQTETAAVKAQGANRGGPFVRGLSALYTRATVEAADELAGGAEEGGGESSYLACVVEEEVGECGVKVGVIGVEVSTGDLVYGEFGDGVLRSCVEAFLLSLAPSEILMGSPLSKQTEKLLLGYAGPASHVRLERDSRECFSGGGALAEVMTFYENKQGNHHMAIEVIMSMSDLVVQALALTIRYLKQFGLERVLCLGSSFRPFSSSFEMTLSANALEQLEILRNNSDGSETGSLLRTLNHTLTVYGSRLLRHWVTHPLCDRNMITGRLDAVSELRESMVSSQDIIALKEEDIQIVKPNISYVLSSVLSTLGKAPDIQRGITRSFHQTASPNEFIAVIQAILHAAKQLQQLHLEDDNKDISTNLSEGAIRSELLRKLILTASSPSIVRNGVKLLSSLNKDAADQKNLQNLIISNDRFHEVATARKNAQSANEKLDSLISLYRKQLRMSKLEFITVSGTTHLIELPVDAKVPMNWIKVNSTKKTIRYHPPEVLTALDKLALANEELNVVCRSAWKSFLGQFGNNYAEFQAAIQALSTLDCLNSLAILSRNKNYVHPVFAYDDEPVQIQISDGRHPILESVLQDNFVPNDTVLHAEGQYGQIITGPNMGGKSCYIRQVALIAIMAQVGSFVPASSAKLHVLDGIYTRMGASDSIQRGRSTFLEELSEASTILRNCTNRSLVIIDELGRGTSTHDGVAIAYATLHHLLGQKRCMVLFVTHYPKITDIIPEFPNSVGSYHVSYLASHNAEDFESDNDVTYLYKLVPGVSQKSFGLKVAELAQLPPSCLSRAAAMAAKLEILVSNRAKKKSGKVWFPEPSLIDRKEEEVSEMETNKGFERYKEFFSNLNGALSACNHFKSFQLLKMARGTAMELIDHRIEDRSFKMPRLTAPY